MALINCPECGHEISDTARHCPHCGYVLKSIAQRIPRNNRCLSRIIITVLVLLLAASGLNIILRPNIQMGDFDIENNQFSTLLFLGIPTEIDGDEWIYESCNIHFYDIPVKMISYNLSSGNYHVMFDGRYQENLQNTIEEYCDYSGHVYLFKKYTYKSLELSVEYSSDFCFVNIT